MNKGYFGQIQKMIATAGLLARFAVSIHAQPRQSSPVRSQDVESAALPELLPAVSKFYNVKFCNPLNLRGIAIRAVLSSNAGVEETIVSIGRIERSAGVYLVYSKGVIYVSNKPFPTPFVPDSAKWPCRVGN